MYKKRKQKKTLWTAIKVLGAVLLGACFSGYIVSNISKVSPKAGELMNKSNSIT